MRSKVSLLVVAASAGGCLAGLVAARWPGTWWLVWLLMLAWTAGGLVLAQAWVCGPFDRLLSVWDKLRRDPRPGALRLLPVHRQDEVGQIARAMFEISAAALRDGYDARQLRRTLDHRIANATQQATRQLRQIAMRDALTDLGNRRFLDENLDALVQSVQAGGGELACVMIDMDNFKRVNDTLGHAQGDELLIFLASLIRASIRREDYAVRLGGDEFTVLLPNCPADRVAHMAEQLIVLFRQHTHTALPEDVRADLSMGVALMNRDGLTTGRDLLAMADQNLYAAKRAGKGRVHGV